MIDYSAEVARIYDLEFDTEREQAYAALASRLREERDALMLRLEEVRDCMTRYRHDDWLYSFEDEMNNILNESHDEIADY